MLTGACCFLLLILLPFLPPPLTAPTPPSNRLSFTCSHVTRHVHDAVVFRGLNLYNKKVLVVHQVFISETVFEACSYYSSVVNICLPGLSVCPFYPCILRLIGCLHDPCRQQQFPTDDKLFTWAGTIFKIQGFTKQRLGGVKLQFLLLNCTKCAETCS